MNDLELYREELANCDAKITEALKERYAIIEKIMAYKEEYGMPILQPEQEEKQKKRLMFSLHNDKHRDEIYDVFERIQRNSKKIQARKLFDYNIVLIGFMGAGKSTISDYLSTMFAMEVVSIGLTLIGLIFLQPLLHLLNTPTNIIDEAYSYIFFIVLFIIVMFAYNLCAGLMRAIGNSVMPLVFLVVSSVLNIILDLVFITQLNMGVQGAAVATVISQGTSVILCIIYMFKKTPLLLPKKEHFEVDKDLYKELLGQGFSMGFMSCIVSGNKKTKRVKQAEAVDIL